MKTYNKSDVKIFGSAEKLAKDLAEDLKNEINDFIKIAADYYLSISGGSTPVKLYKTLAGEDFKNNIFWNNIHLFWCDERMVPPESDQSNYGNVKKILLHKIPLDEKRIHRIKGESNPEKELKRYSNEINNVFKLNNNLPVFNRILLGLGEDGHTASLFPGTDLIIKSDNISGIAIHPKTGQHRISLTLDVINNAKRVTFIVTGKDKSKILSKVLSRNKSEDFPAAKVKPVNGKLDWFIDEEAARDL